MSQKIEGMQVRGKSIACEIVEHIGTVAEYESGWTLEVNRVSWDGRPAKLEIRKWSPDHSKSSKVATYTDEEFRMLCEIGLRY